MKEAPNKESNSISPNLRQYLESSKSKFHENEKIETKSVEMAVRMLDYFNKNKLILAGYKFNNDDLVKKNLIESVLFLIEQKTQNLMHYQMMGNFCNFLK
jgi:hypothetical protein